MDIFDGAEVVVKKCAKCDRFQAIAALARDKSARWVRRSQSLPTQLRGHEWVLVSHRHLHVGIRPGYDGENRPSKRDEKDISFLELLAMTASRAFISAHRPVHPL